MKSLKTLAITFLFTVHWLFSVASALVFIPASYLGTAAYFVTGCENPVSRWLGLMICEGMGTLIASYNWIRKQAGMPPSVPDSWRSMRAHVDQAYAEAAND